MPAPPPLAYERDISFQRDCRRERMRLVNPHAAERMYARRASQKSPVHIQGVLATVRMKVRNLCD